MTIIQPELEWEPLSRSTELRWRFTLATPNPIGNGLVEIEIKRGRAWELEAVAVGTRTPAEVQSHPDPLLGQDLDAVSVEASRFGTTLRLQVSQGALHGDATGASRRELHVQGDGEIIIGDRADAIARSTQCMIWCLNGPDDSFLFDTWTSRRMKTTYTRTRADFSDRVVSEPETFSDARDAVSVPAPSFGQLPAVLARVPTEVPIDHTVRPVAIEFAVQALTDLPTRYEIDCYVAALSFVVGRRMVPVGVSFYDAHHNERLHVIRSSWALDVHADCSNASTPPVDVSQFSIGQLAPSFLAHLDEYKLKDAMWRVWMAESTAVENQLPVLAAAFDGIVSAWFKSTKTKSHGKYLPDEEWAEVSREAVAVLAKALEGKPNDKRIVSKVRNANNLGVNERYDQFFDEIELPIGNVERAALKNRNRAAHGGSYVSSEFRPLIDTVSAYHTMLMRVILRLLEWDGEYVDYSTHGFPSRRLVESCGGPKNDGVPAEL